MNITATLHSTAFHQPADIALIDNGGEMDYASLSASVRHYGLELQRMGIGPGMGVGVMGMNSRYFIIMIYAVIEAGAVVMPVSAQISAGELQDIMQTSQFHALLHDGTGPAYRSQKMLTVESSIKPWMLLFRDGMDPAQSIAAQVPHPALVRFTSGTTGTSKGVLLSHQTIEARTRAANDALKLGPGDNVVWVLSMAYHFVVSIILYLRYGCKIVICDDFHATGILEHINRHQATFLYASPMHIRMLAGDLSGTMVPSLKTVISTSTGISREQCEAFQKRYGVAVSQAYGIIEVGLPVINTKNAESDPQAIGHALAAYKVEIFDDDGNSVPPGTTGHLVMRGPGMFDAYLFPFRLRQDVLLNGWFYTGDLASKNAEGLIRVEGRMKSMINVAGNKVFPEEVEAVLNRHPAIKASRVSGFQHALLGECVKAELILREAVESPGVETLRIYCREHLSAYKVPQRFEFVEALPMTDSGKVKRQ